jgi:transcriptional regulator GlxA family with amidase domain
MKATAGQALGAAGLLDGRRCATHHEIAAADRARRSVRVSEQSLTRHFEKATGMTPLRYQQALRLERAEHLIGHGASADAAARAVGFQEARMLRRLRARRPAPGRDAVSRSPGVVRDDLGHPL